MRLSLLLFAFSCITYSCYAQSFMRLKNLQLGPSLSFQVKGQDTTIDHLRPITKDPQHFPHRNIDTMRSVWTLIRPPIALGGHISLLTTWEFYSNRKKGHDDRKEWRIGIEYTDYDHRKRSMTSKRIRHLDSTWEEVSIERKTRHLGLYTDFIIKKAINRKFYFYFGAGGYLSYTVRGNVKEIDSQVENYKVVSSETYLHATHSRRDLVFLFPLGFDLFASKSVSRVGLNFGMRPGVMLIKETMLPVFASPVIGFNLRLIYNLH